MITIKQGAKIKCKKCNKIYDINPEDFPEADVTYDERNMGAEAQYLWQYDFQCDKCQNSLILTVEGYEYPIGILNYQESNSEGCVILEKPSLEVNYEEEDYANDY